MTALDSDTLLDVELAYTQVRDSCRAMTVHVDIALRAGGELRECRRRVGHEGEHASGFFANRVRWSS